MTTGNWKVVTGDDGNQYYEVEGRVTIPWGKSADPDAPMFVAVGPGSTSVPPAQLPTYTGTPLSMTPTEKMQNQMTAIGVALDTLGAEARAAEAYTVDSLMAMVNTKWTSNSNSRLPLGLTVNTSTGTISGTPTVAGQYELTMRAESWLPGDPINIRPPRPEPELPKGRFQNLDWEEES